MIGDELRDRLLSFTAHNSEPRLPDFGDMMRKTRQADERRQAEISGRFDAEAVYQNLLRCVHDFQNTLEETEEIGLQLANFGLASELRIRNIYYLNPNIIEFHGLNLQDNKVTLIQHTSQLNFMLTAVKPFEAKPYRIGF